MVSIRKFAVVAASGAIVLAACGGSDDPVTSTDTENSADTDTTEAPNSTESESTEAPDSTEPESTEAPDGTDPATTEGDDSAPSGEAFAVDVSNCEDPDAASAVIEDTIKIGTSIPLSGGPAVLFAPFGEGQQAYIDYYNAEFGGVNGQELELVIKDDQYTADLTVSNVDELVFDEEVDLISGVIGSANNLAVQEDLNAQCIPQLNASTGAPNWGDVGNNPWTTGLLVPYAVESQVWAQTAAAQGATTAGLFYVNNEFGQAYAEAFTAAAEAEGIDIIAEETIEAADSGAPSGQVTNLVAAAPDTILAVPLGAQCAAFMTEIGNQKAANPDFAPSIYQTATCANPLFFGLVTNGGSDGIYTSANLKDVNNPELASDEGVAAYLEAFAATGSEADPGGIAVAGWESMEVTVRAIQEAADAGNLSREGIINAARNVNYSSPLLLDGLTYSMNAADGYLAEGTQLQIWSDADAGFTREGEVFDLDGTLGVFSN
jgi:branched-chain amino acid transport system substrate-binding protein